MFQFVSAYFNLFSLTEYYLFIQNHPFFTVARTSRMRWYKKTFGAGVRTRKRACTWPSLYLGWGEPHEKTSILYWVSEKKSHEGYLPRFGLTVRSMDTSQMTMHDHCACICMEHGPPRHDMRDHQPLTVQWLCFCPCVANRSSQRERQRLSLHVLPGPRSIFCEQATVSFRECCYVLIA